MRKLILLASIAAIALMAIPASAQKICIDPGHGGSDPGGTGLGDQEKIFVLDTGLKLRSWLNLDTADSGGGGSWTVIMTRTTDVFVSLSGRSSFANSNGANRFMSIHSNAFGSSSANGIETFCHTSLGTSADLRNKVYDEAIAVWPLTPRGKKTANFSVLANTSMPAILHEMAFITNATDNSYLSSSSQRDTHAKSEMWGLQRHYGQSKYTPSASTTIVIDNTSGNFTPGSGWWTSSSTPGYYGSNYRVRAVAATSDPCTWAFNLSSGGNYTVSAWWSAGGNRTASAPYIVYHSGGSTTSSKNQRSNGGKWNSLGTYNFNSGSNSVILSCWTSSQTYVIADAVRVKN